MKATTRIRWALTGIMGKALLWLWAKSVRMRVEGWDEYARLRAEGKPVVILAWHRRIFLPPYFFRKRGVMPLISPSQDGEIIAQIVRRWGFKVSRGSSSHSIIRAWFEMKDELDRGGEVLIVPDGPRGPARVLKPGCVKLAQQTGAVLVPFTFSASKAKVFKSWDRFVVFLPFSRVLARLGPPIAVDPGLGKDGLESERARIEKIMVDFEDATDAVFAGPSPRG